nr:LptF/LptG family permease [Spirochaetota bacterium]
MFMRKIDQYIIRQFLFALSGSITFMVGVFLITNVIDQLKYFSDPRVPGFTVFLYLINYIPEVLTQILPAAALFSTSFMVGYLNQSNEIVAIYNGGIAFTRLLIPLLLVGVLIALGSFFFSEFVAADASKRSFELFKEIKLMAKSSVSALYSREKFYVMGKDETVYYIEYFNAGESLMNKPMLSRFDDAGVLSFQLAAEEGRYNPSTKLWDFKKI